jgi:hypothetical protein
MEIRELATTDTYNKKMIPNLGIIFSFPQKTTNTKNTKKIFWKDPCNFYKNRIFRPIQNTSVKKILFGHGRFSIDFSKRKKQENCRVFPGLLGGPDFQNLNSS